MIDPKILRDNPDIIRDMLMKRRIDFPLEKLLELDKKRRMLMSKIQDLNHKRNVIAESIALKKRKRER